MTVIENIRFVIGCLLIATGCFLLLGGLVNYFDGSETLGSFLSLGFFMGGLPIAGGFYLARSAKSAAKERRDEQIEKSVLQLAAQKKGVISPAEVAANTDLSLSNSERYLQALQLKGFMELKITAKGEVLYRLNGFIEEGDRESARDVLDSTNFYE